MCMNNAFYIRLLLVLCHQAGLGLQHVQFSVFMILRSQKVRRHW